MSAVLDRPRPQVFEPVNYHDTKAVGMDTKRWVFFAGDLIVPERKQEISWLAVGGEETPSPCLHRFGRGFAPRGLASILETGGEPIPMRHLGDLQTSAWAVPLNEEAQKNKFGLVPVFPGYGLRVLLRYASLVGGNGIGEVSSLRGKSWEECHNAIGYCPKCDVTLPVVMAFGTKCTECLTPLSIQGGDGILDVLELAMFGDGMERTLKGLERQIASAQVNDSRIDFGKYKDETLKLCDVFRNWAGKQINVVHGLLKTGHVGEWQGGWSYSYPPITEMLLDQLEIPRQDQPLQEMARLVAQVTGAQQAPQAQGISAVDMEIFERKMEEKLAKAREADAQKIAELEARLALAPTEPETYTCEHCNEEMKASAKGIHISRWCSVLHPKTEE